MSNKKINRVLVAACCTAACCTAACALVVPVLAVETAYADMLGISCSAHANVASAEALGNPIDWLLNQVFGAPSDDSSNDDAASNGGSSRKESTQSGNDQSASSSTSTATGNNQQNAANPSGVSIDSESDAVNYVHDNLMRVGQQIPRMNCEGVDDQGRYRVVGYEEVNDGGGVSHTAIWFRYLVSKDGSLYDEVLLSDINPATMRKFGTTPVRTNNYYEFDLPSSLANAGITYTQGSLGGSASVGVITSVVSGGELKFEVACYSSDWGPEGAAGASKVGSPSSNSNCVVYVTVPAMPLSGGEYDTAGAKKQADEYARYVTLL